ncbi:hypothetical protein TH63_15020 [Rufibacter radiotolerans]|uniref:Uncharacterized protein n=1 Tax=Rufibacter radiotolerans TaxID=1379910 RepID=A0A0H4VMT9_9BACT|nr:hypothetical protein TH63_15020 [Rufibacter radiotolerans]
MKESILKYIGFIIYYTKIRKLFKILAEEVKLLRFRRIIYFPEWHLPFLIRFAYFIATQLFFHLHPTP